MRRAALLVPALLLAGCGGGGQPAKAPAPAAPGRIRVTSPAFREGGRIPKRFTCDGGGTSPPLRFRGVPAGSAELVLLMEDPDAPNGTFVHWVVAGVSPATRAFDAGRVPSGAQQLQQSFGKRGYGAPCPPRGDRPHRYVLTLYALGRKLPLGAADSPDRVRSKVEGAATARGRLTVTYGR